MIQFTIPGKAVPKARPRLGKGGHTYTPKTTQDYEKLVRTTFQKEFPDHVPYDRPLWVRVCESRQMPESWSYKQKQRMWGEPCGTKPDIDNILKAICDSLNGIAWTDDNRISSLHGEKRWDFDACVSVMIQPIDEEGRHYE